ncbi:hypothetical protein, partial [Nocardia sp. NPDC002869]|uniref:hypothetical protein n=1 Tax=Nocardia sp. NPDC002869 TaxID=3161032 RepID=UPI00398CB1EF
QGQWDSNSDWSHLLGAGQKDEPRSSSNEYDPFSQPVEATPAEPELFIPQSPKPEPAEVEPQLNPDGSPVITWVEVTEEDEPTGSDFDPFELKPSPETVAERKAFVLKCCQGYSVEDTAALLTAHFEGFNYGDCRAAYRSALENGYLSKVVRRATV